MRFWARHNSVRLAAVAGPVASLAVTYPDQTRQIIELLPAPARAVAAFIALTVLPIWARTKPQPQLWIKPDGQ